MMHALPPGVWLLIQALEQCLKLFGITTAPWHSKPSVTVGFGSGKWWLASAAGGSPYTVLRWYRACTIQGTSLKSFPLDIQISLQKEAI